MNLIARKFGTLFFLVLVIGVAGGAIMAQRGMHVTLGPVRGVTISLGQPTPKAVVVAAPAARTDAAPQSAPGTAVQTGQSVTASASGLVASRPTTGTVQQIDGTTITLTTQSGVLAKAIMSSSTTYMKNTTITTADIKIGDNVTVVGQSTADGSITALQVTDGAASQTGGAGGFTRQGGSGGRGGQGSTSGQTAVASVVAGAVQSIDSSTMTVAEMGGQIIKVTLNASTGLHKTTAVTLTDISAGEQVTITGQIGADGSIAATVVQISSPS